MKKNIKTGLDFTQAGSGAIVRGFKGFLVL
jgi:hypothetical protein